MFCSPHVIQCEGRLSKKKSEKVSGEADCRRTVSCSITCNSNIFSADLIAPEIFQFLLVICQVFLPTGNRVEKMLIFYKQTVQFSARSRLAGSRMSSLTCESVKIQI